MTRRLVIIGAGGFGRETLDVVEAINRQGKSQQYSVIGVLDDFPSAPNLRRLKARNVPFLGPIASWLSRKDDADYVIGVGNPDARRRLSQLVECTSGRPVTLVHPQAVIGSVGKLSPGTVICSGAQLSTNVKLGFHTHINPNATVGHDSVLGDYVSVNPAATISGECVLGDGVLVGAASVILQGLRIGDNSIVGAAACVVRDVSPGTTVKGVPAR